MTYIQPMSQFVVWRGNQGSILVTKGHSTFDRVWGFHRFCKRLSGGVGLD